MRNTLLLAILTLSTTTTASTGFGDDGLFSKVRLNTTSPASSSDSTTPRETRRPQARPLSGTSELQTTLLAAGYTARINDNDTLSIELSRSDWSARVRLAVAESGRQLRIAMQLTESETNTVIAPNTLRAMLQANRSHWGASFALAGTPQHIELVTSLPNQGLDSDRLRTELEQLADIAEKTRTIWNTDGVRIRPADQKTDTNSPSTSTTTSANATTENATTPDTTQPEPARTLSLTGKWIATPTTNEAFALQIEAPSKFRLVHVKGTQSNKSQGTWTLTGTTLTLKGDDGTTITGSISREKDRFTLTMATAGGKSARITFKAGR